MPHHFARLARRHFHARFVNQADVMPHRRTAYGVQFPRMQVCIQNERAAAFGHAIKLDQPARPACQHIGLQGGCKGRTGAKLDLERGQVKRRKIRQQHDPLVLHWHQHGVGGAPFLSLLKVRICAKLRHQNHCPTKSQRGEKHDQRGVGIQRRGQQRDRAAVIPVGATPVHVHPAHAMRLHDAFGLARGA